MNPHVTHPMAVLLLTPWLSPVSGRSPMSYLMVTIVPDKCF